MTHAKVDEDTEGRVLEEVERRSAELVDLIIELVGFDTTARGVDDPPREEAQLQELLEERLRKAGAETDLCEPSQRDVAGSRLTPEGLAFDGRPQLVARFPGVGGGRSLLFNGHIDVVSSEPRDRWTSDPDRAEVRDGNIYGRGTCDMKGGIASMVIAAEALASLGVRLRGDLLVCTVTDEESTGCGALAAVAHGVRADAGVVTEPSSLTAWVACRGAVIPTVTVPGRPGHAGMQQPAWREGGAVNAIEKAVVVMNALRELEDDWRTRRDLEHRYVPSADMVATSISAGEWMVSYPASCEVVYHVAYPPTQADIDGWGSVVMEEIAEAIRRTAAADPWLAEHPPTIRWSQEVPSAEVDDDSAIVQIVVEASGDAGRPSRPTGFHSWFDGATFTRFGSTPSIGFGPGDLGVAHTIDEYVPIRDVVDCSKALALSALRFCGVDPA